ncbi:MAG: 3-deoxy-7-phosphoheptulonate synthase, partial [Bacillota bacterium]
MSWQLVGKERHEPTKAVAVGKVLIGGTEVIVAAGPCAVESEEQIIETARAVSAMGARLLRGGAYKPRSSPYSFQGLAEDGLKLLRQAKEATGLPIVTEVMDPRDVELVANYAELLQVGSRNMQNFPLLRELGQSRRPILLKRGLSSTIEEWLLAAEHIMAHGNDQIILCERGIRTFDTMTRNTLDLAAVGMVKQISHLPVIVDPSHATGRWRLVQPMSMAAVAAGADGLMIEVHPDPDRALSDGPQSLTFGSFRSLMQ